MDRHIIRRGIAVLLLAAGIGLAGAWPAAAEETARTSRSQGWLVFWAAVVEQSGLGERMSGIFSFWQAATQSEVDKGFGVDPNGGSLTGVPTPPAGNGG